MQATVSTPQERDISVVQDLLPVELSTNADGATIAVLTLDQPGRPVVVIVSVWRDRDAG